MKTALETVVVAAAFGMLCVACGTRPAERVLHGVRFRIDVPRSYRITQDDTDLVRWTSPTGLELRITVYGAAYGRDGTPLPCERRQPSEGSSSELRGGVEYLVRVEEHFCVASTGQGVMCAYGPGEGDLGASDAARGRAICRTLRIVGTEGGARDTAGDVTSSSKSLFNRLL